ncbi:NUDIX hydrolase [haloarchaeon 3A1-DGR]|nr:NUDIX hydrolase [haloarchaeon 3A1-DGR]
MSEDRSDRPSPDAGDPDPPAEKSPDPPAEKSPDPPLGHEPAADLRDLPAFADGRTHSLPGEPDWPVESVDVEYETGWLTAGYDRVEQPDGTAKDYYWAELPPATVVVAIADGEVLFVEQYRPTIRRQQLELPAGIVEPGESYADAAARELAEETGFAPAETTLLQEVWCSTGVLRHRRGYVLARELEAVERDLDTNEFLDPRAVRVDEALETARRPGCNDATLEGLLLAKADGYLDDR